MGTLFKIRTHAPRIPVDLRDELFPKSVSTGLGAALLAQRYTSLPEMRPVYNGKDKRQARFAADLKLSRQATRQI
jgi:hypothetical protein